MADKRIKMAVVVGASVALNEKTKNPSKTDATILKEITEKVNEIVNKIDLDEFD